MAQQQLRVLLDISRAAGGYCGMVQDVRLLYKSLALCPEVELTGLVYHPRKFAPLHRFCSPSASRGQRLANQSQYLWSLAQGAFVWPNVAPLRAWSGWRQTAAALLARRAQLDRLDVAELYPALWRMLFGPTLSAADMPLVQNGEFLLSNLTDGMIYARALLGRRPIKLDTRGYDFLVVQGPRPLRISPGTRLIVRYHDMIPVTQPDTMSNPWVIKYHHRAIQQTLDHAFYVCNSEPTRENLIRVYPQLRRRSVTIPYSLADAYRPDTSPPRLGSIVEMRRSTATGAQPPAGVAEMPRYIMSVSTLEPRKNFLGLIEAYNAVRSREAVKHSVPQLKLLIVGSPGWNYGPILSAMRPLVERGDLIHLEGVTSDELRALYTHAEAFVFPSHAEGFGFPPLEAMQCDTPVIASDLAEHRWVLGDAALYCNSYDVSSIADSIGRLLASPDSAALRQSLVARGRERVRRYDAASSSRRWLKVLGEAAAPAAGEQEIVNGHTATLGALREAA